MWLPLGDGRVEVTLDDCDVTLATPPGGDPVDPAGAARDALLEPHGPRLRDRLAPDDQVAVVVTDVTRAVPERALLDALVTEFDAADVPRERLTVVVGLGLHRPLTDDELVDRLGPLADLAVNHDPAAAVGVGRVDAPGGEEVAVEVHPAVAAADRVVSTGMVEPHQYAGFSGGAKTVVVGAGGEPLIGYTHGPALLSREGVRLGRVDDNPFRETLDRAGDVAGPEFCLNVTHGPEGLLGAAAGRPRAVVRDLAAVARDALAVPVGDGYDAVVAGVGAPKDANLYQASRAATYVILGAHNPLRPGGRVVVPAALPEGAGEGTGERRFHEWLAGADSPEALYGAMREGYEPGAQRAFVLARALLDHDAYVTDSAHPDLVEECLMEAREHVAGAVEPGSRVLVVPDALHTLLV
jgi:nickel-dependent lactate racemase